MEVLLAQLVQAGIRHRRLDTHVIEVDLAADNLARLEAIVQRPGLATEIARAPGKACGYPVRFVGRAMANTAAPTAESAALLAAVVDNPDDDGPRRIYSDWLLERGDLHGELIAVQCEYARTGASGLWLRASELLAAHWRTFAGELANYCDSRAFERGFVTWISIWIRGFLEHGERLLELAPITTLIVRDPQWPLARAARFAESPALRRVRELRISLEQASPCADIFASPHLSQLRRLDLRGAIRGEDLVALRAPALEALAVHCASTGPHVVAEVLASLAARPALTSLTMWDEGLRDDAVEPLFRADTPATLRELQLRGPLTDASLHAIARSPKVTALRSLRIFSAQLSAPAIRTLLAAAPALERVGFPATALTDELARYQELTGWW